MLTAIAVSITALLISLTGAKEVYHSQKTILCPRVELNKGSDAESRVSSQKKRLNIAAAPVVKKIGTRRATGVAGKNGNIAESIISYKDEGTPYSHSDRKQSVRRAVVLGKSSGAITDEWYKRAVGTVGKSTLEFGPTVNLGTDLHTQLLMNKAVNISSAPFGVFDAGWASGRTSGLHQLQKTTSGIKESMKFHMPYCSIVPRPNAFSILGNILASLRLLMIDQRAPFHENPVALFIMATLSSIPLFVIRFATLPSIMDTLRKRWAFQGECGKFTVEDILRITMTMFTAESLMKLALRAWFYGRTVNWSGMLPTAISKFGSGISQYLSFLPSSINMLGSGVLGGYWNADAFRGLIHLVVHTAVFARLALVTAVQHALYRENFHTASFLLSPFTCQLASAVTGVLCAIATAASVGTVLIFKNFANAVDVEHLLDSSEFRATESQAAATGYVRNALHNIPQFFKSSNVDILVRLTYYHDYLVRLMPRGIEWPLLLFHFSLALHSNSATGLYIALVNLVYAVVNQRLSSYERSILTRDIDEIVHDSS
ncbi:brain 44-like [Babesia ovis]|uniref:Brain 44-like n=1 Tax=Babesia ovis TaxID=5869 RepID=A0A9W5WVE4_BABOV|nr:brain 44-like [Babesia ovis]